MHENYLVSLFFFPSGAHVLGLGGVTNSLLTTNLLIQHNSALNLKKYPWCATFIIHTCCCSSIKILKEADIIIHQFASPRFSLTIHSSCPELAENVPDDWGFTTFLSDKQVPLWFLSWCCSLVQKELVGNTPKAALFSFNTILFPGASKKQAAVELWGC